MNIYSHAQLNRSTGAVGLRQLFGTIAGLMLSLLLIFSSGAQAELNLTAVLFTRILASSSL